MLAATLDGCVGNVCEIVLFGQNCSYEIYSTLLFRKQLGILRARRVISLISYACCLCDARHGSAYICSFGNGTNLCALKFIHNQVLEILHH